MKYLLLLLAIPFLVVSCDSSKSTFEKTHDATGDYVQIKVVTFPTENKLRRYLSDNDLPSEDILGLAQWAHPADDLSVVKRCEIYVVEPKTSRSNDNMNTWGHELMHCMYGSFHK